MYTIYYIYTKYIYRYIYTHISISHLQLVEVAEAGQTPVHVLHHGHEHELLRENVHVSRPVLHLAVSHLGTDDVGDVQGGWVWCGGRSSFASI